MTVWLLLFTICSQVFSETKSGHDDTHIETLLQMLWYESTPEPPTTPSTTPAMLPFFEDSSSFVNITAQLGTAITLHCKVNDLSDKTSVSWMRRLDGQLHLLSVGKEVYSSDFRYSAIFVQPNDWQLQVDATHHEDEGQYECQVSSHPPIVYIVFLHVVVPELEIADERGMPIKNKFYNSGSTIELKCIISRVPQPSHFIMWKHGQRILNYDTSRGGISVKTDIMVNGAKSRLFIANANSQDSGNYSCNLANVAATTVAVHVLNGETPAAMQHGGSTNNIRISCLPVQLIVLWLLAR